MKMNQKGFGVIELLLSVIAIAAIVFVGFYIYNSQQDDDKSVNKETSSKGVAKDSDEDDTQPQYVSVKELGIKVEVTDDLKGLKYNTSATDSSMVALTTTTFQQAVDNCNTTAAAGVFATIGDVTRVEGRYDSNATPVDFFSEFAKQFPDFYITYGTPDGGITLLCKDQDQAKKDKVQQLFDKLSPALKKSVQNAKQL